MKRSLLAIALCLAGCAHPARIQTTVDIAAKPPDAALIVVTVRNQEDRATTPLLINAAVEWRNGGEWSKPVSPIHPAAFVLSRREQQILRSMLKVHGDRMRVIVTVKEQETGRLLFTTRQEQATPAR